MFEVCLVIAIGIVAMISLTTMWWNEAVLRYDLALKESNEALEEAIDRAREYEDVIHEMKHLIINDEGADYITKARAYALVKELEE